MSGAQAEWALPLAVAAASVQFAARAAECRAESVILGTGARRTRRTGAGVAVLRLAGALLSVGGAHCAEARAAGALDAAVHLQG